MIKLLNSVPIKVKILNSKSSSTLWLSEFGVEKKNHDTSSNNSY